MSVGEWVKSKRNKLGLTRRQLGAVLGVREQTVGSWEIGKRMPDVYAKKQLRKAFGEFPHERP